MKYEGMIFRPPSEANSLILQVTVGCSYNRCTFCGAYQGKSFRVKTFDEVKEDIDEISAYAVSIPRVFLADGDALAIPQEQLINILSTLKTKVRGLERVGIYANARDILKKSVDELNATVDQMIRAAKRVKGSGILLSVTVLLGIGGVELSQAHAEGTGKVLSQMDPDFVGALSLMVVPGTPIEQEIKAGRLVLPTPFALIQELETLIHHSEFTQCFFASNHASNYLPVRIRMPEEKKEALQKIREVLRRKDPELLRPEHLRAL
jgi:radical SAM superfamily enzyme YgiQ (UPF0313 family)